MTSWSSLLKRRECPPRSSASSWTGFRCYFPAGARRRSAGNRHSCSSEYLHQRLEESQAPPNTGSSGQRLRRSETGAICRVSCYHDFGILQSRRQVSQTILQHALPKGFVKIRYFGFFGPACRSHLAALRQQLQNAFPDCDESSDAEQGQELAASALAPILRCPSCGQAMRLKYTIQPTGRCPP